MKAYKTVVWDGREYSVPVEMKWLTVDEDGEVNVRDIKPSCCTDLTTTGFWMGSGGGRCIRLREGSGLDKVETYPSWKETLTSI